MTDNLQIGLHEKFSSEEFQCGEETGGREREEKEGERTDS
jgi:hypothetical protein